MIFKRWKELALVIVSIIISVSLLELLIPLIYSKSAIQRRLFAGHLLEERKADVYTNNIENDAIWNHHHIVHPYLGYIGDYTKVLPPEIRSNMKLNKYGFFGTDPLTKRSKEKVIIAVFGGSVAASLIANSEITLADKLRNSVPELKEKTMEIISVALGGFKQPQQLFALMYFLTLGAEYDVVINLDGFNEIALPYHENVLFGVAPHFPRSWRLYGRRVLDLEAIELISRISQLKRERNMWNNIFARDPLKKSMLLLIIWDVIDRLKYKKLLFLEKQINAYLSDSTSSHQVSGPFIKRGKRFDYYHDMASMWKESSLQMARLADSNGFKYFHFLQPNQYYKESKIFTDEEKTIAITQGEHPWRTSVELAYDLLIKEGDNLKEGGVNFTNLIMMFKNERRTVYIDNCCHFNRYGYDQIAIKIAAIIADNY